MSNPVFNIVLGNHRVKVEIFYISTQVQRYKVTLQEKYFLLEENLLSKSDKWKLREQSDNVDIDKLLKVLPEIIEGIQNYFKPPPYKHQSKSW